MSYCRFSEGDVYMYPNVSGGIVCCACRLSELIPTVRTKGGELFGKTIEPCPYCDGEGCLRCTMHKSVTLDSRSEAIEHLLEHRRAGDYVPESAIDRLKWEIEELGDTLEPRECD